MGMTSHDIQRLLMAKHSEDVYVPECKDGPTYNRQHYRFDGWALKRTYNPVTTIGYEIKVSRADFLRDEKWQLGIDLVHQFYFVVPYGMVKKEEVPKGCGLIQTTKQGKNLRTLVRAPRRDIEILTSLLLYVIMSRSVVMRSNMSDNLYLSQSDLAGLGRTDRLRVIEEYVESRKDLEDKISALGRLCSSDIARRELELKLQKSEFSRMEKSINRLLEVFRNVFHITDYDLLDVLPHRDESGIVDLIKKRLSIQTGDMSSMKRRLDAAIDQLEMLSRDMEDACDKGDGDSAGAVA